VSAALPIKDKARHEQFKLRLKDNYSTGKRDYMLWNLSIATGFRAGDLLKLTVNDVKKAVALGYFEILEGKKANAKCIHKRNIVKRHAIIQSNLRKLLVDYVKNKRDYEYMFTSNKGKNEPLSVDSWSRILREAARDVGLKQISAHSGRKTYAWNLYTLSEKDIDKVKKALVHSDVRHTEVYLGVTRDEIDDISRQLNDIIG
jgi:integrase